MANGLQTIVLFYFFCGGEFNKGAFKKKCTTILKLYDCVHKKTICGCLFTDLFNRKKTEYISTLMIIKNLECSVLKNFKK